MKKIAAFILIPLLLVMGTVSVSAKNHDSHYDFYGKAGPTTIEKIYTEKMQSSEVTTPIALFFTDVGNAGISVTKAITAKENVKATLVHLSSQYAETTGKSVLRRPVTQYASPWDSYYRSTIAKRQRDIIRPPAVPMIILAT